MSPRRGAWVQALLALLAFTLPARAEPEVLTPTALEAWMLALRAFGVEAPGLFAEAEAAIAACPQRSSACAEAAQLLELAQLEGARLELEALARERGLAVPAAAPAQTSPAAALRDVRTALDALEAAHAQLRTEPSDAAALEEARARTRSAIEAAEAADDAYRARRRLDRGRPELRARAAETLTAALARRIDALPEPARTSARDAYAAARAERDPSARLRALVRLDEQLSAQTPR